MKRSLLLLGSLAFLVGCASAPTTQTVPTPSPKPVAAALDKPTYPVQRGTVVDQLQLSGRVGAVQQQDLSFTQDGHLKTLYVTRTSVITAGELLAELDLGELPNQLRQAQVGLEQAQLAIERDKTKRVFDERRAQLDLADARAQLADLSTQSKADDLVKAQAAVQDAHCQAKKRSFRGKQEDNAHRQGEDRDQPKTCFPAKKGHSIQTDRDEELSQKVFIIRNKQQT